MLKTIKTTKQMRLDELIEYAFDNDVKDTRFNSSKGAVIYFDKQGGFTLGDIFSVKKASTFTVEVEEEINNTTIFKSVVGVLNNDEIMLTNMHTTIEGIQDRYGSMKEIYAVIDGKLQLVWERDE